MDHVRGAHKVPEEVQNIKLETLNNYDYLMFVVYHKA